MKELVAVGKDILEEIKNNSSGFFKNKEGYTIYLLNGKFHREDGPAIEQPSGTKFWYLNGEHHRNDGPALEFADGDYDWYYYGYFTPFEDEFYDPAWRKRIEITRFL